MSSKFPYSILMEVEVTEGVPNKWSTLYVMSSRVLFASLWKQIIDGRVKISFFGKKAGTVKALNSALLSSAQALINAQKLGDQLFLCSID